MKHTRKRTLLALIGFAFVVTSVPLAAAGSKDVEEGKVPEGDASLLRVIGERPPAGFGEGGGRGAAAVREGFRVDPGIIGEPVPIVSAEMTEIGGTLKVKGGKGKRTFTLNGNDGKKYTLQVESEKMEDFAALKGKKLSVRGVFYSNTFLVFEYGLAN